MIGMLMGVKEVFHIYFSNRNVSFPDGWTYQNHTLTADLVIKGLNGTRAVLQDDLRNSYSVHDMPVDTSVCPRTARQQSTDKESYISGSTSVADKIATSVMISIMFFCVCVFYFMIFHTKFR